MDILLFDPVGDIDLPERAEEKVLDTLKGKVVGYIFNQHNSSLVFWKHLEENVESALEPPGTVKVYKPNTWAPAPKDEIERIIQGSDYALVGVGA
jgi:hypothetical protein